jgi:cobalt-zinc-cadmium efflux system outer membrane protein
MYLLVNPRVSQKSWSQNPLAGYTRFFLLWIVFVTPTTASRAQSGQVGLTVIDLVEMAVKHNRDFLAAGERVAEAQALLRQAGLRPTPTFETELSTGKPLQSPGEEEYSAAFFQPIETAGKRSKRTEVARISLELRGAELEEARRQLVFEVKMKYAQAIAAQQKVAAIDHLMSVGHQTYTLTEARVREGDAAPLEQDLLLTELNRSEAQQHALAGQARSALLDLRKVVGLSPSEPLQLADSAGGKAKALDPEGDLTPLAELQEHAMQNRPDLRVLRIQEGQAAAETTLARAEGKPDLTASVRYIWQHSQFPQLGFNSSGGLVPIVEQNNLIAFGLSVPVFTGRRARGAVDAAVSRQAQVRLRREFLESSIPLEVEAVYREWEAARSALSVFASGVIGQSEKNVAVIRESYRLGQLRIIDVLNEQRRLIDTELAYIDAQLDLARAMAELERAVGGNLR